MSTGYGGNGFGNNGPRRDDGGGNNRPRRDGHKLTRANDVILSGLASNDLSKALRPHMAKAIWARTVGPQVAGVTQPVAIRGGDVLVVRVKNGVWANELTLLKDDILRRLNRGLGGSVLADIFFTAGGLRPEEPAREAPSEPSPEPEDLDAVPITDAKVLEIEGKVRAISDPQLQRRMRENLMRMAQVAEWKRRNGWKPCESCGSLAYPRAGGPAEHLCDVCRIRRTRQL
jgi:predicted nucleic acid-binding Zn ribbon protein